MSCMYGKKCTMSIKTTCNFKPDWRLKKKWTEYFLSASASDEQKKKKEKSWLHAVVHTGSDSTSLLTYPPKSIQLEAEKQEGRRKTDLTKTR